MSDLTFMSLMVHTCTITQAGESVATSESYGHQKKSYTTSPAATYTDIPCRLRPLTADEQTMIGRESETTRDWYLYIPVEYVPASMQEHAAASNHRVSNVVRQDGVVEEEGPLDVRNVRSVAGEVHHYLILVRKAG